MLALPSRGDNRRRKAVSGNKIEQENIIYFSLKRRLRGDEAFRARSRSDNPLETTI